LKLTAASRGESSIPEVLLILDSLVYPTGGMRSLPNARPDPIYNFFFDGFERRFPIHKSLLPMTNAFFVILQ